MDLWTVERPVAKSEDDERLLWREKVLGRLLETRRMMDMCLFVLIGREMERGLRIKVKMSEYYLSLQELHKTLDLVLFGSAFVAVFV